MPTPPPDPTKTLIRDVAHFQLKLWFEAGRDLVLIPLTLIAAVVDLAFSKHQPPRFFRQLIDLGRRSDEWIDPWAKVGPEAKPENADALLAQVEGLLRDPRSGTRRGRVLLRWAERNIARQRAAAATQTVNPPAVPPPPPPLSSTDGS
jgi:hypothetical protein